jgi:hypothetical protein
MPPPFTVAPSSLFAPLPTCCAAERLIQAGLLVCAALLLAGCASSTEAVDEEDPAPGAKTEEEHADRMGGVSTLDADKSRKELQVRLAEKNLTVVPKGRRGAAVASSAAARG